MEPLIALGVVFIPILSYEFISVFISHKNKKCADCDSKSNLIISRYTFTTLLGIVQPTEWRCNYHYRKYHNVTHDDFTTELDSKEIKELRKLTRSL